MDIRVITPAFRARDLLPRCMLALANSTMISELELVVVDDGENGDLAALLRPYAVASIVREPPSGSAAVARNRGASGFHGKVIVFVDADVETAPDAIARLVAPIQDGDAEATVGACSTDVSGMSFAQKYKQLYLARVYSRSDGYIRNHFWTALSAVRADIFFGVGAFNPRFKGACDEDTELGQRLTAAGHRILSIPEATVRNLKPYSFTKLVLNDLKKGISTVRLSAGKKGVKLTDNRHSTRADILAVSLTGLGSLGAVMSVLPTPFRPAGMLICGLATLAYLTTRRDLLTYFAREGPFFLLRSAAAMFTLDLLRLGCVGIGFPMAFLSRRH